MHASRTAGLLAALGLAGFGLFACGPGGKYGSAGTTSSSPALSSSSNGVAATGAALVTKSISLGTVVADRAGHTVYAFDKDTKGSGKSACTGTCAGLWPAVTVSGATPVVRGLTGNVGTITRDDGSKQVTLDGRPLYTYAKDADSGDAYGQGFGGSWWAVGPTGAEVSAARSTSSGY